MVWWVRWLVCDGKNRNTLMEEGESEKIDKMSEQIFVHKRFHLVGSLWIQQEQLLCVG